MVDQNVLNKALMGILRALDSDSFEEFKTKCLCEFVDIMDDEDIEELSRRYRER